jgi:hypothetical protein
MRSLQRYGFWIPVSAALFFACEPDYDALSTEFGFGGVPNADGGSSSGGTGGGLPGSGGALAQGGSIENPGGAGAGGVPGSGGSGGEGGEPVTPDACSDKALGLDESDIDCGGTSLCARCGIGAVCTLPEDCASAVCKTGHCAPPSCTDGVQNQDETAKDCGGVCTITSPCATGLGCAVHADCASDFCSAKICTDHCLSRKVELDETDVDCGGPTCLPCADGKACEVNADCSSAICKDKLCVPPSCDDGLKNQDETEKDCGGVCRTTKPCTLGAKCLVAGDCDTYVCTASRCVADIVVGATDMIDDVEDGNLVIMNVAGRAGNWFPFGDGTGIAVLEPVALASKRAASTRALHYAGSGFTKWGSGIGFDFNNTGVDDTTKKPWDASAYTGMTFWAKATAVTSFTFQLPDRNTQVRGGICTTCDHHWQTLVQVGTDWARYTVKFADLQLESGTIPAPTAFDKTGIIMMQLFFSSGKTFDIWVDDVALVK